MSDDTRPPLPPETEQALRTAVDAAREALDRADASRPLDSLPLLRVAQEHLTSAVDEAMAASLCPGGGTFGITGALASMTENAVDRHLARTNLVVSYNWVGG